jgi:hypothetical protein
LLLHLMVPHLDLLLIHGTRPVAEGSVFRAIQALACERFIVSFIVSVGEGHRCRLLGGRCYLGIVCI